MYHGLARLLSFILGTAKGEVVGGVAVFVWANAGCLLGQLFFFFFFSFFFFHSFVLCLIRVMVGRGVGVGGDKWRRRAGSQGARFWSG